MVSIVEKTKNERERKMKAAAAGAAVALALKVERETVREFPLPERVSVSAWQAVLRSNIHSTRGNVR